MDTTNQAIKDALTAILISRQQKQNGPGQGQEQDPRLKQPQNKNQQDNQTDNQQGSSSSQGHSQQGNNQHNSNNQKSGSNQSQGSQKKKSPQIGDHGNKEIQDAEEVYRKANVYKEDAKETAENADDKDLEKQSKDLAKDAGDLAKDAKDLKNDIDEDEASKSERTRLKRIQDRLADIEIRKKALDETERAQFTSAQLEADKKYRKEYEDNPEKRLIKSVYGFIKNEITTRKMASWKRPDKRYSGSSIIHKGKAPNHNAPIPRINIYYDHSGSWSNPAKIQAGNAVVASLRDFERKGELKIGIYYFGDDISSNPNDYAHLGCGTSATQKILDHAKATHADNVIIMTDDDMDTQGEFTHPLTVNGGVWFIFKDGYCKKLTQYLHGRKLTKVFGL